MSASSKSRSADPHKETWQEQIASFVGFFIYLLILKTFFLPLFIIPTGSMAQTLYGAHAIHTCPNCGVEYPVGWQPQGVPVHPGSAYHPVVQCPNCRWREYHGDPRMLDPRRPRPDSLLERPLRPIAGDRIFVNGWPFDDVFSGAEAFRPQRWDVVVFKVPTDGTTNYIKRLIGRPNEKIELIDGNVYVNDQIARKPPRAQESLWFDYYNHDYPPGEVADAADYHPRWVRLRADSAWREVESRVPRFDGLEAEQGEIQFATDPDRPLDAGRIEDVYAYNEPRPDARFHSLSDVRLSAEIDLQEAAEGGYVELSTSNGEHYFYARLFADRTVKLLHRWTRRPAHETWGTYTLPAQDDPVHLALYHVDGQVGVEIDGKRIASLTSTDEQYGISPETARKQAQQRRTPALRIAGHRVQATFRHVLIERDVYYTSDLGHAERERDFGTQGHPIELGPHDYYLLGDNSPSSLDARFAFSRPSADPVGPHLQRDYRDGSFQLGTVPEDQLIGPAFFVYWPGFLPLTSGGPNILPDLGRVRWIH